MMVFRNKPAGVYLTRVRDEHGTAVRASTGTPDRRTAQDVEAMVRRFVTRREWAALNAIVAGRLTLPAVYDADRTGTLAALLADASELDLEPMVAEWAESGAPAKYVTQVRRLIPAGERFPRSRFSRANVSKFLATLTRHHGQVEGGDTGKPASGSTRNRYRAALSVFARFLIEREVIDANPVRDVRSAPKPPPRLRFLSVKQGQTLLAALPKGQHQALEAFMAGSGVELGALLAASRRDLDMDARTLHCFPGDADAPGKTKYRSRLVEVTEAWAWPYIEAYAAALPPNARLFTISEDEAHRVHDRTIKALRLPSVTLHQWRHAYAVPALKRKDDHQDIKRQLGHAPQSTLIYTTYGVYLTAPKGYRKPVEVSPISSPAPRNEVKSDA